MKNYEATAQTLHHTVELDKQSKLRYNVTVTGIKSCENENLVEVVMNVFNFICSGVSASDITTIYRLPFGNMIVVQFSSIEAKSALLESKTNKNIKLSDVMDTDGKSVDENAMVYVNTHLTPYFGRLISFGRRAVREGKLHSCYMSSAH